MQENALYEECVQILRLIGITEEGSGYLKGLLRLGRGTRVRLEYGGGVSSLRPWKRGGKESSTFKANYISGGGALFGKVKCLIRKEQDRRGKV